MKQDQSVYIVSSDTLLLTGFPKASARPVVQFCDLSKYIQDSSSRPEVIKAPTTNIIPPSASSLPIDASEVEPDNMDPVDAMEGLDEDKELDDELWEDEGDEDEGNDILLSAHKTASSSTMDLETDDGVDVSIPQLRNYLNDSPVLTPLVSVSEGSNVTKRATASTVPKVFQVPEMTF